MSKSLRCKLAKNLWKRSQPEILPICFCPNDGPRHATSSGCEITASAIWRKTAPRFGAEGQQECCIWNWTDRHCQLLYASLVSWKITTGHCSPVKNGKLEWCDVQLLNMTNWPTSVVPMTLPFHTISPTNMANRALGKWFSQKHVPFSGSIDFIHMKLIL